MDEWLFPLNLERKTAIVTGAGSGIGKACAMALAHCGAKVACFGRTASSIEAVTEAILADGRGEAVAIAGDISAALDVEAAVKRVVETWGRIDICVNNAGIAKDTLLLRMKEEDWDAVLNVNLKGAFLMTKLVSRLMLKQESGVLCNVASIVGITGNAAQANYAAAKGGLIAFTKSCAREFGPRNIRVNAVAPGFIETKMTGDLPIEIIDDYKKRIALGRLGNVNDVAKAVVFLCSDWAAYITGQTLIVDGGMVMQ